MMVSMTYNIAKYFANVLRKYTGQTPSHVFNNIYSLSIISNITVESSDLLVSLDVSSFFAHVPISDTIVIIQDLLSQEG